MTPAQQQASEPAWIEHDGSSECPVPAGHDVERKYWPDDHDPSRSNKPEMADWVYITHYRDWTAFEQQEYRAKAQARRPLQPLQPLAESEPRWWPWGRSK